MYAALLPTVLSNHDSMFANFSLTSIPTIWQSCFEQPVHNAKHLVSLLCSMLIWLHGAAVVLHAGWIHFGAYDGLLQYLWCGDYQPRHEDNVSTYCFALPCPALPCFALPCLALPCLNLLNA